MASRHVSEATHSLTHIMNSISCDVTSYSVDCWVHCLQAFSRQFVLFCVILSLESSPVLSTSAISLSPLIVVTGCSHTSTTITWSLLCVLYSQSLFLEYSVERVFTRGGSTLWCLLHCTVILWVRWPQASCVCTSCFCSSWSGCCTAGDRAERR